MRLLEILPNGDIRLTRKWPNDAIPRYAILSHTWGDDSEEVTFEDMVEGHGRHKVGFEKINFCGKQAARDGIQYFWVDSCCIKKSSDSELSESINCMFRWYQRAAKCYVYLSDISIGEHDVVLTRSLWEPAFRDSRWFTRGWTLQELLAPASVEFFSSEGKRIGDRESLVLQIHNTTGIEVQALKGSPLSEFTVDERLRWAANRTTKLEEDEVYSLMGIFEVSMAPRYGEGRQNALNRLYSKIRKIRKNDELVVARRSRYSSACTIAAIVIPLVLSLAVHIIVAAIGGLGIVFDSNEDITYIHTGPRRPRRTVSDSFITPPVLTDWTTGQLTTPPVPTDWTTGQPTTPPVPTTYLRRQPDLKTILEDLIPNSSALRS